MKNIPQRPSPPQSSTSMQQRESADEKIIKALLNRAMKDVLAKQDETLLKVAQSMVNTGQVKEKVPQKTLSDDELRSMLEHRSTTERSITDDVHNNNRANNGSISDTI